jgi:hypothetical protein
MNENGNAKQASALSKINLVLIILIILFFFVHEEGQDQFIQMLLGSSEFRDDSVQPVDFSVATIQQLADGFLLSQASQDEHLTGMKFRGRIVNTQSVAHHNVTFTISVGDQSKEFVINKISPGNSTGFDVYLPEISADKARFADITYVSSSVSYYTK